MPDEMDPSAAGSPAPGGALHLALRTALRQAEHARGSSINVKALAKQLHLSVSSLYAYLDGKTLPTRAVLDNLLRELGVTGAELGRIANLRDSAEDARRANRKRSARPRPTPTTGWPAKPPCQLPPDVRAFTGRTAALAELDDLLAVSEESSAPLMAVVSGTAGVGKTALAIHWGHRVRDEFPDGLLYVDLRGFDPQQPREPVEVLCGFLRALGVAADSSSRDVAELAAVFRSELDRKRILLLLDNASSEEQVRPLLPNSARSVVVVTSRQQLSGLVARNGAHRIDVPRMPVDDAVCLLRSLVSDTRMSEDEQGAVAFVQRCARLPLTIRIGADLANTRKRSSLAELAEELHRYHLDLLASGGDERTAVRAVFSWSYLHLRSDRTRAFRLLSVYPGHDIDRNAGAALLGTTPAQAHVQMEDLVRASLLEESGDGRYRMNDLLRAYGRERTVDGPAGEGKQAMLRLLDYHLGTAAAAMDLLAPYGGVDQIGRPAPATGPVVTDAAQAAAWLDAERRNLLTLAEFGAHQGWPNVTIFISTVLSRYLDGRAHYGDAARLHSLSLEILQDAGATRIEGQELQRIGIVHMRLGHHGQARDHLEKALTIGRQFGDRLLESRSLHYLGLVSLRLGHNAAALEYMESALPVVRDIANRELEGHLLSGIGFVQCQLGRYPSALLFHRQALRLARQLHSKELTGHILNSLGLVYQRVGDADQAYRCHRQSWGIAQNLGIRGLEADSLKSLGAVRLAQGRPAAAIRLLKRALPTAAGIGQRDVEGYARRILGQALAQEHEAAAAMEQLQTALFIARDTGNRELETETLNECGAVVRSADSKLAIAHHENALAIARDTRNPWQEARSLDGLADVHLALDNSAVAQELRTQAHAVRAMARTG